MDDGQSRGAGLTACHWTSPRTRGRASLGNACPNSASGRSREALQWRWCRCGLAVDLGDCSEIASEWDSNRFRFQYAVWGRRRERASSPASTRRGPEPSLQTLPWTDCRRTGEARSLVSSLCKPSALLGNRADLPSCRGLRALRSRVAARVVPVSAACDRSWLRR